MTKIYRTQSEIETDIKDSVLKVNEDVEFECSFSIEASLKIAGNINARDINAGDINAGNINAWDINARDINALDINAGNINAWDINAWDITFYAVCFAYMKFVCKSIKGRRKNSKYFCLDGEVEIEESANQKKK